MPANASKVSGELSEKSRARSARSDGEEAESSSVRPWDADMAGEGRRVGPLSPCAPGGDRRLIVMEFIFVND